MKVIRAAQIDHSAPESGQRLDWVEGPHMGDRLDVGLVHVAPGAAVPVHGHNGGQVIVVLSGRGFVERDDGTRVELGAGDIFIAEPGDSHSHGALPGEEFHHITITTGTHILPDRE